MSETVMRDTGSVNGLGGKHNATRIARGRFARKSVPPRHSPWLQSICQITYNTVNIPITVLILGTLGFHTGTVTVFSHLFFFRLKERQIRCAHWRITSGRPAIGRIDLIPATQHLIRVARVLNPLYLVFRKQI